MNSERRALLQQLHDRNLYERENPPPPGEELISLEYDAGLFVNMLARSMGARAVLEIGASHGVSGIWFADAMESTGGMVTSLDISEWKAQRWRENMERAGLSGHAEILLGDALESIAGLSGPFDLVLIDADKERLIHYLEAVWPKLRTGGIALADNMIYPETARGHAEKYQQHVRSRVGALSVLVPVGSAFEMTLKLH